MQTRPSSGRLLSSSLPSPLHDPSHEMYQRDVKYLLGHLSCVLQATNHASLGRQRMRNETTKVMQHACSLDLCWLVCARSLVSIGLHEWRRERVMWEAFAPHGRLRMLNKETNG